ncbi:unnamed protein product [Heterosigma akashiwo]
MFSTNLKELELEMEAADLLAGQLRGRATGLARDRERAEAAVVAFKARAVGRAPSLETLEEEMALIEKAAGLKAREKEVLGHVKRAEARYKRLRQRVDQLRAGGYPDPSDLFASYDRRAGGAPPPSSSSYRSGGGGGTGGGSSSGSSSSSYRSGGGGGSDRSDPFAARRRGDTLRVDNELEALKRKLRNKGK